MSNYLTNYVTNITEGGEALFECDVEDDNLPLLDTGFDSERCLCCSIEGGHTLVHTPGGRGYGLGTTAIYSGKPITADLLINVFYTREIKSNQNCAAIKLCSLLVPDSPVYLLLHS